MWDGGSIAHGQTFIPDSEFSVPQFLQSLHSPTCLHCLAFGFGNKSFPSFFSHLNSPVMNLRSNPSTQPTLEDLPLAAFSKLPFPPLF